MSESNSFSYSIYPETARGEVIKILTAKGVDFTQNEGSLEFQAPQEKALEIGTAIIQEALNGNENIRFWMFGYGLLTHLIHGPDHAIIINSDALHTKGNGTVNLQQLKAAVEVSKPIEATREPLTGLRRFSLGNLARRIFG
jgi:hypothetical protein